MLNENKHLNENSSKQKIFISKQYYKTEVDKLFYYLANNYEILDIRATQDEGFYKVAFINQRKNIINVKKILIPLSFFKIIYGSENNYTTEDLRIISRG